jgi:hypothetical protein
VSPDTIKFPYSGKAKLRDFSVEEKELFIDYLTSRENYYKNTKISSLSEWRYQEINYIGDNDTETSWRGHRIYWHDNSLEEVTLDLGSIKLIDRLVWYNWTNTLSPTAYTIETSSDNKNWITVREVKDAKERKSGEMITESFTSVNARYVKMKISKTTSGDAPSISEVEVVEAKFSGVDIAKALQFMNNPFAYIEDSNEYNLLLKRAYLFVPIIVTTKTNSTVHQSKIKVNRLESFQRYEVLIPAGGTDIEDVKVEIAPPFKLEVSDKSYFNPSFESLKARGAIKNFSTN